MLTIITLILNQGSYAQKLPHKNNQETPGFIKPSHLEEERKNRLREYDYTCKNKKLKKRTHKERKKVRKAVNKVAGIVGDSAFLGLKGLLKGGAYLVTIIGRFLDFETYGISSVINILFYVAEIVEDFISLGIVIAKTGFDIVKSISKIRHVFERDYLQYYHLRDQCLEGEDQLEDLIAGKVRPDFSCKKLSLKDRVAKSISFLNPKFLRKDPNCGRKSIADYGREYKEKKKQGTIMIDPFLWSFFLQDQSPIKPVREFYALDGAKKCQDIKFYGHDIDKDRRENYLYYLAYGSTPFKSQDQCLKSLRGSIKNNLALITTVLGLAKVGKVRDKVRKKKDDIIDLKNKLKKKLEATFKSIVSSFVDKIITFAREYKNSPNEDFKAFADEILKNEKKVSSEEEILKAASELADTTVEDLFSGDDEEEGDINPEKVKNYLGFFDRGLNKGDVIQICGSYFQYISCRDRMMKSLKQNRKKLEKMGFKLK